MLPNFLIVGAQKAGSTWFAQMLRQHPDIYLFEGGEIHFFNARHARGLAWYESHFEGWNGESAVGEKSPLYLTDPDSPRRIRETLGEDVRLIASLRNPVDRAYSAYWHRLKHGRLPVSQGFPSALESDGGLREHSLYAAPIQRLFDLFPKRSLLILIFEEVMADQGSHLARCFDFLGVEPGFRVEDPSRKVNAARDLPIFSRELHRIRRGMRALPPAVRRPMLSVGRRVAKALPQRREHARLGPTDRARLRGVFEEDVRRLEGLLDRDLSVWR